MSKQLPMAINPSIESKQHILENLLNCFTFVDTEKQLVIAYPVFLHLGYTKESARETLSTPMLRQYTNHKGFVPREDFFISIPQIGELIVNAPKTKYVSDILEFVKTILIPLFNQPQQLIKHDDFKKETIVSTNTPAQNQSQKFHSDLFGDLTVLTHSDGSLWFIANEVCEKLGYGNPRQALSRHCKGVTKRDIPTLSGIQSMNIIPERDIYRLVMRSKLPTAEQFEEFVVSEVLPAIRKTGSYGQSTPALPTSYKDALLMLAQKVDETEELAAENERLNKTKMQISSKREASAMGKLARANDKIKQLTAMANVKDMSETIQSKAVKFATILAIQSRVDNLKANGLKLANFCRRKGLEIKSVDDVRFGRVNSYPAEAWSEVYNININSILGA